METAGLLVSEGFAKAGYNLIILDDCWLAKTRVRDGRLRPDPVRFPSGIRALADYVIRSLQQFFIGNSVNTFIWIQQVHERGLRFGIYEDFGDYTCAGYPGILGNLELNAETFADWQIDYVKLDGCNSLPSQQYKGNYSFIVQVAEWFSPQSFSFLLKVTPIWLLPEQNGTPDDLFLFVACLSA